MFDLFGLLFSAVAVSASLSFQSFESNVLAARWLSPTVAWVQTNRGRFHVSTDSGATWVDRTPPLMTRVSRVQTDANAPDTVYLFDDASAWRSVDGAATFSQAADKLLEVVFGDLPGQLSELRGSAGCEPRSSSDDDCFTELFASLDNGKTFRKLLSYVDTVSWSPIERTRLMVTTWLDRAGPQRLKDDGDLVLLRVDIGAAGGDSLDIAVLGHGVLSHLYAGNYFVYARRQANGASLAMVVSRDERRFDEVQFRGNFAARAFTILSWSNSSLIVAAVVDRVFNDDETAFGALFASDFTGVHMKLVSRALVRRSTHLYDFTAVNGEQGVFLANFGVDGATHYSFDGAATFKPTLRALEHRDAADGARTIRQFLSSPGVLLATSSDDREPLVSLDFGATWSALPGSKVAGDSMLALANLSLALVVQGDRVTSWRVQGGVLEGGGGVAESLGQFGLAFVGGGALSTSALLVARNASVVARLAFDAVGSENCTAFVEFDFNGGACTLGRRLTVRRRASPATCDERSADLFSSVPCDCTLADYQCDVGYERDVNNASTSVFDCKLVVETPPSTCVAPATYDRASFRLKPGSACRAAPQLALPAVERGVVCPAALTCECGARSNAGCVAHGVCQCDDGWAGALCNRPLFRCLASSCANGGKCRDTLTCDCAPGWRGIDCSDSDATFEPDTPRGDGAPLSGVQIFFIVAGAIAALTILVSVAAGIYLKCTAGRRFVHLREDAPGPDEMQSARA
jgi:hypothetical protein